MPSLASPAVSDRPLQILRRGFPGSPGLDIALSRALLIHASDGVIAETFRLNRPGRVVAFGKQDTLAPGYRSAAAAARAVGYDAVERLAGGRAAVFHEGTLAFSWAVPDSQPKERITERFEALTRLIVGAFGRLGVTAEVGEVPGEYCPGGHSVHVGDRKLMGVGQRLARNAAHVGGVIVVTRSEALRDVLVPVYEALGLEWNPATAGALDDVLPGVGLHDVEEAVLAELGVTRRLEPAKPSADLMTLARDLAGEHLSP
jgi:octanoyl-[GcvH]:protein N-octanoyltransferase